MSAFLQMPIAGERTFRHLHHHARAYLLLVSIECMDRRMGLTHQLGLQFKLGNEGERGEWMGGEA